MRGAALDDVGGGVANIFFIERALDSRVHSAMVGDAASHTVGANDCCGSGDGGGGAGIGGDGERWGFIGAALALR